MTKEIVIDSYALMVFLGQESGYAQVEEVLKRAQHHKFKLKLTAINLGEIFYSIYKAKGKIAAQEVLLIIDQLPIEIIDVDRFLVMQAALIKAQFPISYADAFVVALAKEANASVITGDKEFKSVAHLVHIDWLK